MRDQAAQLRTLVLRSARQAALELGPAPRLVALSGGKGGVGASTLAVNLAIAAAQQAARVVLVDADLYRADVAALCGLGETDNVADVLAARRDIHEILQLGPGGIQVACGAWAPDAVTLCTEHAQERLLRQLKTLGRHADLILLDVGHGGGEVLRRFWRAADEIVVVTTPDQLAVMDAYATLKSALPRNSTIPIRLVVNQAPSLAVTADVHGRIDQSCRRFLDRNVQLLGGIPCDERVPHAASSGVPLLIESPDSGAALEIERLAALLMPSEAKLSTASAA